MSDITKEELTWLGDGVFSQRRIVSAANRYTKPDGGFLVIPCVRHYSKEHHLIVNALKDAGFIVSSRVSGANQGFVDQYSNYWTREQALFIAKSAGQIGIIREKGWPADELFSEDLY